MAQNRPLAALQLRQLRQGVLTCTTCFLGGTCRQHEDLLGGYTTGKLLVININPQSPARHQIYGHIEAASWEDRARFGDLVLDLVAGRARAAEHPFAGILGFQGGHPGLRWLRRAAGLLGLCVHQLADNVRFVDLYKVVSADLNALRTLPQWNAVQARCPQWLVEQVRRLQPSKVLLAGRDVVNAVASPLSLSGAHPRQAMQQLVARPGVTVLGGTPAVITYAFSRNTLGSWRQTAEAVRAALAFAPRACTECPPSNEY